MQLASKLTGDAIGMMSYYACQQANKHTSKHTWAGKQANENMIFIYELYTIKIQHSCFRGGSLVKSIAVFLLFPTSF